MFSSVAIGVGFVFGTIGLIWVGYFLMRLVAANGIEDHTKELAGSVIFRVSALHGLILALIFAQELLNYQRLQDVVVKEATAIADIYFDAERHGTQNKAKIQSALSEYANLVVGDEWAAMGEDKMLLSQAWEKWETVYQTVLDLEVETPRQISLRNNMLEKVHVIASSRNIRESEIRASVSILFWIAAVSGIFLVSLAYFCFPPTIHNLTLISIFGAFTGIIIFIIFAFSDPFRLPGAIEPSAIQLLIDGPIGQGG